MSLKKLIYSFRDKYLEQPILLSLTGGGDGSNITSSLILKKENNAPFDLDFGNGELLSIPNGNNIIQRQIKNSLTTSTKIFIQRNEIETLKILSETHTVSTDDLYGMGFLKKLQLTKNAIVEIKRIPKAVREFSLFNGGKIVGGYQDRINFQNGGMEKFVLENDIETGLERTEVDDLLEDLSLASWFGEKLVKITGVNSAPTTKSNPFITTLENKGVTVITN